jgi:hypothetical protein
MNRSTIIIAALAFFALSACEAVPAAAPTAREQQAANAQAAANSVVFEKNAEIENIQKRLRLTSNPGQIGFVLLLNQAGQPIMYTSVRGKITSGSKRLTAPMVEYHVDHGEYRGTALGDGPSDEGTYGHSGDYVFFWTTDGQYIQWNGGYLYSDKPFRTNIQPLVIATASK